MATIERDDDNIKREPEYMTVYCGPCEQHLSFRTDGIALLNHAKRHGVTTEYTDESGFYIGSPACVLVMSKVDVLDWHDAWWNAPDDVWSAAWRLAIIGQDTRTTIRTMKGGTQP
jgi:hypothetical protein